MILADTIRLKGKSNECTYGKTQVWDTGKTKITAIKKSDLSMNINRKHLKMLSAPTIKFFLLQLDKGEHSKGEDRTNNGKEKDDPHGLVGSINLTRPSNGGSNTGISF